MFQLYDRPEATTSCKGHPAYEPAEQQVNATLCMVRDVSLGTWWRLLRYPRRDGHPPVDAWSGWRPSHPMWDQHPLSDVPDEARDIILREMGDLR